MRGFLLMVCCLFAAGAYAGVDEWKTYTPKKEVRAITPAAGALWAATAGGLFSRSSADGSYATFTTSEGLRSIDLTALATDSSGNVWIGASDGILHRLRPSTREWTYIQDIALLDASRKRINAIQVWGDSLMVLSDVGISVYSMSRAEFGDSYLRFGEDPGRDFRERHRRRAVRGQDLGLDPLGRRIDARVEPQPDGAVVVGRSRNRRGASLGERDLAPCRRAIRSMSRPDRASRSGPGRSGGWWQGSQSLNVLGLALPGGSCESRPLRHAGFDRRHRRRRRRAHSGFSGRSDALVRRPGRIHRHDERGGGPLRRLSRAG